MIAKLVPLALALVFGCPLAVTAAAATQPLTIRVNGDGAQATRLAAYDPSVPIAVAVEETGAAKLDSITVEASGPVGESERAALGRGEDGIFRGTLALRDQGPWSLRLITRVGPMRTATTPVTLDVAAPPPSDAWEIGLAVGGLIFAIVGGGGFFILRRTIAHPVEGDAVRTA